MIVMSSFVAVAGKQQCQKYRKKLDNIQAQQRQANSLNRSNSLAERESKARKSWWKCETGKHKPVASKKKKFKNKPIKSPNKVKVEKITYQSSDVHTALMPFYSHGLKDQHGLYEGEKLQAWLLYYRPDKKCVRPRSMHQFAACAEERRVHQRKFEKDY